MTQLRQAGRRRCPSSQKRLTAKSPHVSARAVTSLLALLLFAIGSLLAQEPSQPSIQGTLVDRESREPIGGALVTLVDESGLDLRSVVTADDGGFVLPAPSPGSYRIRVERLGYKVWTSPELVLEGGEARVVTFWVPVEPIPIPGLEVAGTSECPEPVDVRARGYALYREARAGLQAVVEGETKRGYLFVLQIVREQTDTADLVRRKTILVDTVTVVVPRPIASLSPEELAQEGYVREQPGAVARYYAPVPEVLLSQEFLATHCLGVTEDEDEASIGLSFAPMPGRMVPDVVGVLWLDASGRELRRLEFRYTRMREYLTRYRLPLFRDHLRGRAGWGARVSVSQIDMRERDFGGVLEFERLDSGAWITRRWEIRMARLASSQWWGPRGVDANVYATPLTHNGTVVAVALQAADTASARR